VAWTCDQCRAHYGIEKSLKIPKR